MRCFRCLSSKERWQSRHLEVANVLTQAQKRNRISAAQVAELSSLEQLPISVDSQTSHRGLREIFVLATEYQLSSYDAAYLELAMAPPRQRTKPCSRRPAKQVLRPIPGFKF